MIRKAACGSFGLMSNCSSKLYFKNNTIDEIINIIIITTIIGFLVNLFINYLICELDIILSLTYLVNYNAACLFRSLVFIKEGIQQYTNNS